MKFIKTAAAALVGIGLALAPVSAQAAVPAQASGAGSLDGGTRHFAFNAKLAADGSVKGQAQLVNTNFGGTDDSPAPYRTHIDITCMVVVGNTAHFGGIVKSTNDPNLDGAAFFSVQDNGEPGGGVDQISRVAFWDNIPGTVGDPSTCGAFPLELIESGNIQVK